MCTSLAVILATWPVYSTVFVACRYRFGALFESRHLKWIRGALVSYREMSMHSARGHLGMRFLVLAF